MDLLASLTIDDSYLQLAVAMLLGYIVAAIGWGFRVEMKLAALTTSNQHAETAIAELRKGQAANESRLARIETDTALTRQDVAEVKSDVKQLVEHLRSR